MNSDVLKRVVDDAGTPFFIYDIAVIKENIDRLFTAANNHELGKRISIFIAYFTNSNPHIFNKIISEKVGVLLQTEEEYQQLKKFFIDGKKIVSPSFLSDQEIDFWVTNNIPVNLASLEEVKYWIKKYKTPMSLRLDLTFRQKQRTGIKRRQFKELLELLSQTQITPKSIHVYCGTGSQISKEKKYLRETIRVWHRYFRNVKEINLGGGFGFNYEKTSPKEKHFDWCEYFTYLKNLISKYEVPDDVAFMLEPGRDIFADSGTMVLQVKRKELVD